LAELLRRVESLDRKVNLVLAIVAPAVGADLDQVEED
jgi:hypothetical protein